MKYVIMVFNIHTVEINYIFDFFFDVKYIVGICARKWLCVKMEGAVKKRKKLKRKFIVL